MQECRSTPFLGRTVGAESTRRAIPAELRCTRSALGGVQDAQERQRRQEQDGDRAGQAADQEIAVDVLHG